MNRAEWKLVVPAIVEADGINGRWMRLSQVVDVVGIAAEELVKKYYHLRKGPELKIMFFDGTYAFIDAEGIFVILGWDIEVVEEGYKMISPGRDVEIYFLIEDVEYLDGRLAVRDWSRVMVSSGWGTAILKELRGESNGE
jgi:hypothetical protein